MANLKTLDMEQLETLNAGGVGKYIPYIGAVLEIYDKMEYFVEGFMDGMTKPN